MNITSEEELQNIFGENEVVLDKDITISEDFNTIEEFSGTFDGQGYTISKLSSTFIETIASNGVIKNVKFKNVDFVDSLGIFEQNFGVIKSVSVIDLEKKYGSSSEEEFGGIVRSNSGILQDCLVKNSSLHHETLSGIICSYSTDNAKLDNCTVENSCIYGGGSVGGIVAASEDSVITDCKVSNLEIIGTSGSGGICGKANNVEISNVRVESCYIESGGFSVSGVAARNSDVIIQGGDIQDTSIVGAGEAYLFNQSNSEDTVIKDCSVKNCSATLTSDNAKIGVFSGVVKSSFAEESKINCLNVDLFSSLNQINNSYIDIEIKSVDYEDIDTEISCSSNSVYTDIDTCEIEDTKTVKVSKPSDLERINEKDTVELTQDIDLKDVDFDNLERFTGVFDGNGYTIKNLKGNIVKYLYNGTIKNLNLSEPSMGKYSRSSLFCKSIRNSTVQNVNIIKTHITENEFLINGFSYDIFDSIITDCSVSFSFTLDNTPFDRVKNIFGVCNYLKKNSKIDGLSIDFDIENIDLFTGISNTMGNNCKVSNTDITGEIILGKNSEFAGFVCKNSGKIVGCYSDIIVYKKDIEIDHYISGIVNYNNGCINSSTFAGEIILKDINNSDKEPIIGGICSRNRGEIVNCTNKGVLKVEGYGSFGGISGRNSGIIKNCVNKGTIESSGKTGGIIGQGEGKIHKCHNSGDICGNKMSGGIVGKIEFPGVEIENCYNHSHVENGGVIIGEENEHDPKTIRNVYIIPVSDTQTVLYGKKVHTDPEKLKVLLNM